MDNSSIINKKLILVSGPTCGGKSRWAEHLLQDYKEVVYIANSKQSNEPQWQQRVNKHKKRRPNSWKLIEN